MMIAQFARLLRLAEAAVLTGVERSTAYGTPALRVHGKFLGGIKDDTTLSACARSNGRVLRK